jgi:hypothetical protein
LHFKNLASRERRENKGKQMKKRKEKERNIPQMSVRWVSKRLCSGAHGGWVRRDLFTSEDSSGHHPQEALQKELSSVNDMLTAVCGGLQKTFRGELVFGFFL